MPATSEQSFLMADTVADAVAILADRGTDAAPIAGGTWIMRAPIRRETKRPFYVGIGRIAELNAIEIGDDEIVIGACITHARLVGALSGIEECTGLCAAAEGAANRAIRHMATLGGNLSAADFPASDLAPALLSLDATVVLQSAGREERLSVEAYLSRRRALEPGTLLTKVSIARRSLRTGHARLPLRKAGDYPVAIVSMAAAIASDGTVGDIRVAVGSVEATARRWPRLEEQLRGKVLEAELAHDLAGSASADFTGRDSVEAPSWYRVEVLPALVRRASRAVLAAR